LDKTFALLANRAPDAPACYDAEEIEALGRMLDALVYAPPPLRAKLQSLGVTITRADYYSEIPTIAELEASASRPSRLKLDKPFDQTVFLADFLRVLTGYSADFDPPATGARDTEFAWDNDGFSFSDAVAYYAMIRRYHPKTIVEMGCGSSTKIASLACERNGVGRIIAIDPFPAPYLDQLPRVELVRSRIQDIDEAMVRDSLGDGDMLFVDTTHTVKHDSDCLHIYLRILPELRGDIFVHAHDIYLPGPLPMDLMLDHQVYWNEQYLLYSYLIGNRRTRVLYGSAYHAAANPELLAKFMRGRAPPGGASLWFSQSGPRPIG
jgi:hypothetical protein